MVAVSVILAIALASFSAHAAESFDSRMAKANTLLKQGDAEGAIAQYRELQTEDPESKTLYYSLGCAHYQEGVKAGEQDPKDALTSFEAARDDFAKALNARDPEVRTQAAYNHANAVAQLAMQSMKAQQFEETKKSFEESIKEYESFLKQHPDHEGARTNLDHMRYQLKRMLQNPPPPQQQQQGQNDQNQDKKQDDQQKQDQNQQGEENKDQEKKDQQDQNKQNQEEKQQEKQEEKDAQAAQAEQSDQNKEDQKQAEEQEKPKDQQNTEAILQSLEDMDNKQQKETKNQRTDIKLPKDWW